MLISLFFITLILLAFPARTQASEAKNIAKVAVIPLDDRPSNTYDPQMIGRLAGMEILYPPPAMLGQFTTPGNGEQLGRWLHDTAPQVDAFVISASMLAYGGLIASRSTTTPLDQAQANLKALEDLARTAPGKPRYVYDVIQRLSITPTDHSHVIYYNQVRQWAILVDQVRNLGLQGRRKELEELEAAIPSQILTDYLWARERNHEINKALIEYARQGVIDHLILAQDDAHPHGLHRAERDSLLQLVQNAGLAEKVQVFPGTDVSCVLIARVITQILKLHPRIAVRYSGLPGPNWIPELEDIPFSESVRRHLLSAGGRLSEPEDADIHLMVNTPPLGDRPVELQAFTQEIHSCLTAGKMVAIADVASTNGADRQFIPILRRQVSLPSLLSYSGGSTAGNALGTALGQAISRWCFLHVQAEPDEICLWQAGRAQAEFVLSRFAKDYGYRNAVAAVLQAEAKRLGADQWNLGRYWDALDEISANRIWVETEGWYDRYFHHKCLPLVLGDRPIWGVLTGLLGVRGGLPWPRLFEACLEPHLELEITSFSP